jgi:RNA polymerase sigma factor (sigma-70 family)
MDSDDRELLEKIKQGHKGSFEELYKRTRGWLLSFVIIPRVGRAEAEDVLSETFYVAAREIRFFDWQGICLLHWLATIAKRKALEHARRKPPASESLDDVPTLLELPDEAPTAEAEMIRKETLLRLRERVDRTLSNLSPRYAEALRLRLMAGLGRQKCAESLSVSLPTFDVILFRASRAFAREWQRK